MIKKLFAGLIALSLAACGSSSETQFINTAVTKTSANSNELPMFLQAPPKANLHLISIRLIRCGGALGTAVYIDSRGIFMTAHHVSEYEQCTDAISGKPLNTYYSDEENDFALLSMDTKGDNRFVQTSCAGFVTGKTYYSVGFAKGYDLSIHKVVATNKYSGKDFVVDGIARPNAHLRKLEGVLIQGMSGGAMIDLETGIVVGINNVTLPWTEAYSKELKDTVLCRKKGKN